MSWRTSLGLSFTAARRAVIEFAPLNDWDLSTFYGGDERGYIDYPVLADSD